MQQAFGWKLSHRSWCLSKDHDLSRAQEMPMCIYQTPALIDGFNIDKTLLCSERVL